MAKEKKSLIKVVRVTESRSKELKNHGRGPGWDVNLCHFPKQADQDTFICRRVTKLRAKGGGVSGYGGTPRTKCKPCDTTGCPEAGLEIPEEGKSVDQKVHH